MFADSLDEFDDSRDVVQSGRVHRGGVAGLRRVGRRRGGGREGLDDGGARSPSEGSSVRSVFRGCLRRWRFRADLRPPAAARVKTGFSSILRPAA